MDSEALNSNRKCKLPDTSWPSYAMDHACGEPNRALFVATCLLGNLKELHSRGTLHGYVAIENLRDNGEVVLTQPGSCDTFSLNRGIQTIEYCPPELQGGHNWSVPRDIVEADRYFSLGGLKFNPRRIDVYQLGALLCRMVTGNTCGQYLQSAVTRGKVPADLQELVDSALGYETDAPLQNMSEFEVALERAMRELSRPLLAEIPTTATAISDTVHGPLTSSRRQRRIHARLGRYRILNYIGGGGMGDVYQGYEEALDRCVAVKILPPELARHSDFVERFRREALAIAKLSHPHIVQIFAFEEDQGQYYFAMQFVRGESLADLLERRRQVPTCELISIAKDCLTALGAAHSQGLIHRDIKPSNILLDFDLKRALLADFGLAKTIDSGSELTGSGMLLGTLDYASPEQAQGQIVDHRADLYSLGVVMYQMASGRLPFVSQSAAGLLLKHVHETPPRLEDLAPDLPALLVDLIGRLMAKQPNERFQSAQDVLLAIQTLEDSQRIHGANGGSAAQDRKRVSSTALVEPFQKFDGLAGVGVEDPRRRNRSYGFPRRWHRPALAIVAASILIFGGWYFVKSVASRSSDQMGASSQSSAGEITSFAGHRYQLVRSPRISWVDAKTACEAAGGHLTCPVTPEQEEFISKFKGNIAVWLGGYCDVIGGARNWKWITGQSVDPRFKPAKEYPDRRWIATTVATDALHITERAADGTFRNENGNVISTKSTYVQGYICEWDK